MAKDRFGRRVGIVRILGDNAPIKGRNVRIGNKVLSGDIVVICDNVTIELDTVIGVHDSCESDAGRFFLHRIDREPGGKGCVVKNTRRLVS